MKRDALGEPLHAAKIPKKESALYFDSLPIQVFTFVLASLSNLEKGNYWQYEAHIPCQEILELLRVPGSLGTEVKNVCKTLYISSASGQHWWKLCPEEVIGAYTIREAVKFLQAAGGEAIETLVVNDPVLEGRREIADGSPTLEETVESIREHCPNVTSLKLRGENVKVWIDTFGGQVEKLEVHFSFYKNGIRALAKNCTRLTSMTLHPVRPIKIAVCTKSAKTLEYLQIDECSVSDKQIQKIQETCHALKRISIIGDGNSVSKLLASRGNQLEWACVRGFTEDDARRVVSACKSARFEFYEPSNYYGSGSPSLNELVPTLTVLGYQMEKIRINLEHRPSDMSKYEAAWNRCSNLRYLYISKCNRAQLQAVLTTPKPKLESLYVAGHERAFFTPFTVDSNRFTAALDGCINLRILKLSLCALNLEQVQAIMATPKVNLKEVIIDLVWKPTYSESNAASRVCMDNDKKKAKKIVRNACKNAAKIDFYIDFSVDPNCVHPILGRRD